MNGAPKEGVRHTVWDLPTRIFHWALVLLIAYLWWTERSDDIAAHKLAGFALIGLLVFRIWSGFFGPETVRFARFVKGPSGVWRYLRGRAGPIIGHNPLGALSVIAMLVLVGVESGLGLFAIDEDGLDAGPFAPMIGLDAAQRAAHYHAVLFNILLALIALHVAAIAFYWLRGDNLVLPMVTGRKRLAADVVAPRPGRLWALIAGLILATATGFALYALDNF